MDQVKTVDPTDVIPSQDEANAVALKLARQQLGDTLAEMLSQSGGFPSHLRRCFMTGKQCTMHGAGRVSGAAAVGAGAAGTVFVAMPFRHNLSTFYEWSLLPYLRQHLGITEKEGIRRADEFRNVGYVTCEKICRRIQEASLVVADISTPNANVFYELGLAIGLGRSLLVFCEENSPHFKDRTVAKALGLKDEKIIPYPSFNTPKSEKPIECVQSVKLGPREVLKWSKDGRKATPLIRPLLAPGAMLVDVDAQGKYRDDIPVPFGTALSSSIGVAIQRAFKNEEVRKLRAVLECADPMTIATQSVAILIYDDKGQYLEFETVAKGVDGAFALVVDLGDEDPFAYFWLGYCHARGINAIPVHRPCARGADQEKEGVLAFDIRALWYVPYDAHDEPTVLANSLASALIELLPRDLGTLQRSVFWERLTSRRKISIFTGAVHHGRLGREVVGDWDQRTVSELVRYLSQAGETVVTVLEKPVYAPETVIDKLTSKSDAETNPGAATAGPPAPNPEEILPDYLELVREELRNHPDCIVVASADVNPMTEVVLARAYNVPDEDKVCFRKQADRPVHRAVVALKSASSESSNDPPRSFSRSGELPPSSRGFMWGDKPYGTKYVSQNDASELVTRRENASLTSPPTLLGHIAVLPNPFAKGGGTIVVLNGVSGPATFGLAEMLTGGSEESRAKPNKQAQAERMLTDINIKWRDGSTSSAVQFFGVEGLVQVTMGIGANLIGSDEATARNRGKLYDRVRATFYDQRDVSGWDWFRPAKFPIEQLSDGNPRLIKRF